MKNKLSITIKILSTIIILAYAFKLQSCSKKYELKYTRHLGSSISHCSNGIQDYDEKGIDCGGADCNPCPIVVTVPCATHLDSILYNFNGFGFIYNSFKPICKNISNGGYVIKCPINLGIDTLFVIFKKKPVVSGYYNINSALSSDTSVYTYIYDDSGYQYAPNNSQSIDVTFKNNKFHTYICDMYYFNTLGCCDNFNIRSIDILCN